MSNANYGWILNIVSKLSQNGVAGFLLANGALSDDGTELKIRRQLIENNLVEAIIILPRNLFYTTDISVTLWILNKNKKARVVEENGEVKRFRNREREILFMDLRQMGSPYEKKYIELTEEDRTKVTSVYHAWQQEGYEEKIPVACQKEYEAAIMSPAYPIFRVKDTEIILPEYMEKPSENWRLLDVFIKNSFQEDVLDDYQTRFLKYIRRHLI